MAVHKCHRQPATILTRIRIPNTREAFKERQSETERTKEFFSNMAVGLSVFH